MFASNSVFYMLCKRMTKKSPNLMIFRTIDVFKCLTTIKPNTHSHAFNISRFQTTSSPLLVIPTLFLSAIAEKNVTFLLIEK